MEATATPAWYDDISVLWLHGGEFFPAKHHTERERLNAMVRLVVYASVAAFVVGGRAEALVVGAALVAALSLSVKFSKPPPNAMIQDDTTAIDTTAIDDNDDDEEDEEEETDGAVEATTSTELANWEHVRQIAAEASGVGRYGTATGKPVASTKRRCKLSTPNNPFANMLLSDLATDPGRPRACAYDKHADLIKKNFNRGLVRNLYDVYDKENSQRQFMTMPVTTSAADVSAFARYCYGGLGRKTCKEDTTKCTGW